MGMIDKLIALVNKKNQIMHSKITKIFTKYGVYQAKMYKHDNQEYLTIMSHNFFDVKSPILYIHSDTHECNPLDEQCHCNNQLDAALKMIREDGGLVIYSSSDGRDIDALLREINTRKLQPENEVMIGTNLKSALKGYRGEYLTLDFIFKDLSLASVQLVTNNPNIIFIIEQLGIEITKHSPSVSFGYGQQ